MNLNLTPAEQTALIWLVNLLIGVVGILALAYFRREIKQIHHERKAQDDAFSGQLRVVAEEVDEMGKRLEGTIDLHSKSIWRDLGTQGDEIRKLRESTHRHANTIQAHEALLARVVASQERLERISDNFATALSDFKEVLGYVKGKMGE